MKASESTNLGPFSNELKDTPNLALNEVVLLLLIHEGVLIDTLVSYIPQYSAFDQ